MDERGLFPGSGLLHKKGLEVALSVEEMATNIFEHVPDDGKEYSVDAKIIIREYQVTLRLWDDGHPFNPREQAELLSDDITHHIGLRMIFKMSKEMKYANHNDTTQKGRK